MGSWQMMGVLAPTSLMGWLGRLVAVAVVLVLLQMAVMQVLGPWRAAQAQPFLFDALVFGLPLAALIVGLARAAHRSEGRLRHVTECDPLTGLLHPAAFMRRMRRVLPQAGILIMIDLDQLNDINMTRGRQAGDRCLMALAQRCREVTRRTDVLGRMEGATIAIYQPGGTMARADALTAQLREGLLLVEAAGKWQVETRVAYVFADGLTPLDVLIRRAEKALALENSRKRQAPAVDLAKFAA